MVKVLTPASKVTVVPNKTTLHIKERITLKTKILPTNTSYRTLTFQSQNKKIAAVNQRGIIEGRGIGQTRIIVQVKGTTKRASVAVTVKEEESDISIPSEENPQPEPSEENPQLEPSEEISQPEPSEEISQPEPSVIPSEGIKPTEPDAVKPSQESPSIETSKSSRENPSMEASKPSRENPSMEASKPSRENPSMEASKPIEPSLEVPSEKPGETESLKDLKKELNTWIRTLDGMKADFKEKEQQKNVEMMLTEAKNIYKTSKNETEVKKQIQTLDDFCEICWKATSPYASVEERNQSGKIYVDKKGNYVLKVTIKKGQKDQIHFYSYQKDSTVTLQKASAEGYEQEVVVTAANSYTRVYEIEIAVLPENPLYVKEVKDADGVVDDWETEVLGKTDNTIEMQMDVYGYSKTGLTDAFSVIPKQKDATVVIEDYNKDVYTKKITISAENHLKTVYYVYYSRINEWEIKSLHYGGTICKRKNSEYAYSSCNGMIQLGDSYQEGMELTVEPLYDDVQWTVEPSDKTGYQRKIVLTRDGERAVYYVAFAESSGPYILDI